MKEFLVRRRVTLGILLAPVAVWAAYPCSWLLMGAGWALAAIGLVIRSWAAGYIKKDKSLAMEGPYALSRHPLYLGSTLMTIGLLVAFSCPERPVATGALWAVFLVYFGTVYRWTIEAEEEKLSRLFPDQWPQYCRRVQGFWPTSLPGAESFGGGFSWKQWLKNGEYNAILGVSAALVLVPLLKHHLIK